MTQLETKARECSRDFIENEKQYRLGFVEAEQSNPLTKNLGEAFVKDSKSGIEILEKADRVLLGLYETALFSKDFDSLKNDLAACLKDGGRIVISGCGSTGRLAMRIEACWRIAVSELTKKHPDAKALEDKVISLMTGGDYAIIRAVESFEDYISLGEMQASELGLCQKDILIGVTATGETTSILGTARKALENGAKVWMVVCTKPSTIVDKLERAKKVYTHENCHSLYMNCGGMAVTGSTRMQSTTIEQTVISSSLELALGELYVDENGVCSKEHLLECFKNCIDAVYCEKNASSMANLLEKEASLYEKGGHVTYFADEYLLDVLADTTERGPTFSVPAFRPQSRTDLPLSLAFVKNPFYPTKDAWHRCFERAPRCVDKTEEEYTQIGIKPEDIKKIPKINLEALYEYKIGCEKDAEREEGDSLAVWIGDEKQAPAEFIKACENYKDTCTLVFDIPEGKSFNTRLKIFEHIGMKLMMNGFSTGTMARMGRVMGNYMVYINITNKKLVDRATRIVSDLCGIPYEEANYQLFLSKLTLEQQNKEGMAAIETIKRLGKKVK